MIACRWLGQQKSKIVLQGMKHEDFRLHRVVEPGRGTITKRKQHGTRISAEEEERNVSQRSIKESKTRGQQQQQTCRRCRFDRPFGSDRLRGAQQRGRPDSRRRSFSVEPSHRNGLIVTTVEGLWTKRESRSTRCWKGRWRMATDPTSLTACLKPMDR